MKNSFQKKFGLWAFALACGMICFGCASTSPRPEGLEPNIEPAPPLQRTLPAPPQTLSGPREAPPSMFKPGPASPKPVTEAAVEAKLKPKETSYAHTVKWSGETFIIIASWYTGNEENWKAIGQANPNIKPKSIHTGNKILIPETLMKTHEPMPKEFVDRFYSKLKNEKNQAKSQSQLTQAQEEELTLIGPKKFPKK